MRQERIAALKAELANRRAPKLNAKPHESNAIGSFGRGLAKGVGAVPDLLALPANIALGIQGKEPLSPRDIGLNAPSFSELAGQGYDVLTGNNQKPQNLGERAAESAGEFISGGGILGKAGKAGGAIKNFLATKGAKGYGALGTAGVGSELAREIAPESPVAPLVGAIAGGVAPSLGSKLAKTVTSTTGKATESLLPGKKVERESSQLNKILEEVSPSYEGEVNADIRKASREAIGKENKALQEKARPYYEKAAPKRVEREKLQEIFHNNPVVDKAFKEVLKEDAFQADIRKYGVNSIHTLDLVKKNLDTKIANLGSKFNAEKDVYKASKIGEARNQLVEELDRLSPDYKKARSIYTEEKPAIKELQESKIGRFAKLKDEQIKTIGKNIFDKTETNPERFIKVRDVLYKENPGAWKAITRQEIERKIGSTEEGAKHFYDKVLKDEKSYKQLEDALFYNPKAQAQLADLKDFYTNTSNFRKIGEGLKGLAPETIRSGVLGKTIDLIFEPKWSGELKKLAKADKESLPKLTEELSHKLGVRSTLGATHGVKEKEHHEESKHEAPSHDRLEHLREELERRRGSQKEEVKLKPEAKSEVGSELIEKIVKAESGGNPNARAKTSSASGLLQFTNSTWKEGVKRYGEEEGVSLKDKNNPNAQRKIAERMLHDNSKELERTLGRKPKSGEIYATHFLGLNGAKKLLKADKREIAARIFPKEAQANRSIFFKHGRPITVAELTRELNSKVA